MSYFRTVALAAGVLLAVGSTARAQTSLFAPPTAVEAAPAAAPAAEAAPKARPKPRGPTPARSLTITNVSGSALTSLEIGADGKTAKLNKELGTNESATMRLPAFKSCTVTVVASFDRAGEAETMEQNICKDRRIRLTNQ